VQIAIKENYLGWGQEGKGMETDGTGKGFPFFKDPTGSLAGTLEFRLL